MAPRRRMHPPHPTAQAAEPCRTRRAPQPRAPRASPSPFRAAPTPARRSPPPSTTPKASTPSKAPPTASPTSPSRTAEAHPGLTRDGEVVPILVRGRDKDRDDRLLHSPPPQPVLHQRLHRSQRSAPPTMGRCPRGGIVQSPGTPRAPRPEHRRRTASTASRLRRRPTPS